MTLRGWIIIAAIGAALTAGLGFRAYLGWLHADRDAWRRTARTAQAEAAGWKAAHRQLKDVRDGEIDTARKAATQADQACDARVDAARRSSAAVRTIIEKEPRRDQAGCPLRERVDPGLLRDALQPGR